MKTITSMDKCEQDFFYHNDDFFPCTRFPELRKDSGKEIYEVLRVIKGKPLFVEDHYNRFVHSHHIKEISTALSAIEFQNILKKVIEKNPEKEGNLKFVNGFDPASGKVRYTMCWYVPHNYPTFEQYQNGVSTIVYQYERKQPNAKVWNRELRTEIAQQLSTRKAYEALLVNEKGCITEGSKSNIFAVFHNRLVTPPAGAVLPGITRGKIFQICQQRSVSIVEAPINIEELAKYEAFFLTGTSPKILPVNTIKDFFFNPQHSLVKTLIDDYDQLIAAYIGRKI